MGLGAASRASYHDGPDILSSIFSILILFPFTSLQVRRYHDIGLSGKWFIPIMAVGCGVWIPFSIFNSAEVFDSSLDFFFLAVIISSFCFITNFIISCLRPTAGDNKYGSNPLTQNADQRGSVQSKKATTFIILHHSQRVVE